MIIVVTLVAAVVGLLAFIGSGKAYESIGKGSLGLDGHEQDIRTRGPALETAAGRAEQEAELRQMLQAKSDRREARGEAALDIDSELTGLLASPQSPVPGDPALREEVRQLVVARNDRRIARGQDPLEVEAEIDRQLKDVGG